MYILPKQGLVHNCKSYAIPAQSLLYCTCCDIGIGLFKLEFCMEATLKYQVSDIQVSDWISKLFLRNCCSCFLLFYSFKLLLMHFSYGWYRLHYVIIYSLGGVEHSNHGDMVYCIGNAEQGMIQYKKTHYVHEDDRTNTLRTAFDKLVLFQ